MTAPKKYWWWKAEGDVKNQSFGALDMDRNIVRAIYETLEDRIGLAGMREKFI